MYYLGGGNVQTFKLVSLIDVMVVSAVHYFAKFSPVCFICRSKKLLNSFVPNVPFSTSPENKRKKRVHWEQMG